MNQLTKSYQTPCERGFRTIWFSLFFKSYIASSESGALIEDMAIRWLWLKWFESHVAVSDCEDTELKVNVNARALAH